MRLGGFKIRLKLFRCIIYIRLILNIMKGNIYKATT